LRSRGREGRREVAQIRWRGRKGPGFAPRPACLRRRIGRKGGGGLGPHGAQIRWRGRRGLGVAPHLACHHRRRARGEGGGGRCSLWRERSEGGRERRRKRRDVLRD